MMVLVAISGAFTTPAVPTKKTASVTAGARLSTQLVFARASSATTFAPPMSISDTCSTDVTSALNSWFASLPKGATVNLPNGACYLVSNSSSALLTIQDTEWLTINGHGTTFKQNTFDNVGDPQSPVLTIGGNFALTINNVTLRGPGSNGGWNDEGNAGILMWQNFAVRLNGVTITSVEGDGLDVYPLGNEPGVNWYVVVDHSTIENVGYKAIVPEAADHFTVENSTLASDDIDAEVDFSCQPPQLPLSDCGTFADPAIGCGQHDAREQLISERPLARGRDELHAGRQLDDRGQQFRHREPGGAVRRHVQPEPLGAADVRAPKWFDHRGQHQYELPTTLLWRRQPLRAPAGLDKRHHRQQSLRL